MYLLDFSLAAAFTVNDASRRAGLGGWKILIGASQEVECRAIAGPGGCGRIAGKTVAENRS
jgi:hypothetical protein